MPQLDGVLFFPVTPFDEQGAVHTATLTEHLRQGLAAGPGGVFAACGTGEFHALLPEELAKIRGMWGENNFKASRIELARQIFDELVTADEFPDFLTLRAYEYLD